jgi:hypothetical protein
MWSEHKNMPAASGGRAVTKSEPHSREASALLGTSGARPVSAPAKPLRYPRTRTRRPARIPSGACPDRMSAELAAQAGALRGRPKHNQTLGRGGGRPGEGNRIAYNQDLTDQLFLARELEAVAIDPVRAVEIVPGTCRKVGIPLKEVVAEVRKRTDLFLTINIDSLTWTKAKPPLSTGHFHRPGLASIGDWLKETGIRIGLFFLNTRIKKPDHALDAIQPEGGS